MKKIWVSLLSLSLLAGCIGDEFDTDLIVDDVNVTSGVILPLAHTTVTMGDILSDQTDMIRYEDDNIIFFSEEDSVEYVGINDFFRLSEASLDNLPFSYGIFNIQDEVKIDRSISFNIPDATVKTVEMDYTISASASNLSDPILLTLTFPSANPGQTTKKISIELDSNQSTSQSFTNDRIELADNQLPLSISIAPKNKVDSYPYTTGYISIRFGDFDLKYVRGTMTENAVEMERNTYDLDFDVLEDIPGDVEFKDPRISLIFDNATPFIGLIIPELTGQLDDGAVTNLSSPVIELPACPDNQDRIRYIYELNRNNSGVTDFIAKTPTNLIYEGDLVLNPGASNKDEIELYADDRIYVGYGVEVPLDLKLNAMLDEEVIELDDIDVIEDITNARLVFTSENGFPLAAKADLEFYDDDTQQVLETIEVNVVKAAVVNSEGIVIEKVSHTEVIDLSDSQIKNLNKSEEIRIKASLQTSDYDNGTSVVFLKSNELTIKLGIKGQIVQNN
ncbi:hypothetical protein [Carboxylicivirga sp. RSCT41]|uniref:hypothetical protein n=1 Tax=Carboxylicivirga agarovorans TaxID=3417570 RepID=UPI003D32A832